MKLSVVQQPPVYLNIEKSMERAVELIAQSAKDCCQMVVFPEAWFPGYARPDVFSLSVNKSKQPPVSFSGD